MARFLKQSFTQTCLNETDNGKLQQFNYSRSLITNRGTVERGIGCIAKNYYAPLGKETSIFCVCQTLYYSIVVQEQPLCQPITMTIAMAKWEFLCLKTKQSYSLVEIAILIGQF